MLGILPFSVVVFDPVLLVVPWVEGVAEVGFFDVEAAVEAFSFSFSFSFFLLFEEEEDPVVFFINLCLKPRIILSSGYFWNGLTCVLS